MLILKKKYFFSLVLFSLFFLMGTYSDIEKSTSFVKEASLSFTEEEILFIQNHPVIIVGIDPSFVPFEFIDSEGNYKGITADYLFLIEQKTGLEFKVLEDLTWPEVYEKAIRGEVDLLPAIAKTSEREQFFIFSEPYYHFKRVIITKDTSTIKGLEDLYGERVATQKYSSHHSYLAAFPNIHLSLYESVQTALASVADGSEVAFVGNLATTNYLIRSNGLTNLKLIVFESDKQQGLHFAVRPDYQQLITILDKALRGIPQEEKTAIHHKWIALETHTDYAPLIRLIVGVSSGLLLIWLVSIYWIMRLKKEISGRKKIQLALEKAKQEAEEANSFKSSFMARMSHEVRTPLSGIMGMSYLLKRTDLLTTQKMYVERILQASHTMLSIINDLLDFSKIEAGKIEMETISFNLDTVIQDVVNMISYKMEEQKIGFRLMKDPSLPTWFYGDAKRIQQILLNLMNNATKFTSEGEISLEIRLIAKQSSMYHLSFTVKDTGIGMDKTEVGQLFEPFVQADPSINRRFGGTGLGLSIVKNLVELMKGDIQIYSGKGEGSTFIITLPLETDIQKEEAYKKQVSEGYFKNLKTLVLEKTGTNINLIDSYLSAFGMECELTTSEASAINLLELANGKFSKAYDLLILDYDTPSEKGFDFVRQLKQNPRILKMPKVLLLLPMMKEELFDQLEQNDIDTGVGKPIIPSVLFNSILEIFKCKAIASSHSEKQEDGVPLQERVKPYAILVVEDNKTNQLIAKSLLTQEGFSVYMAENGEEGVRTYFAHQKEIGLILMDLHMPVMNGYEAATEIRKKSQEIPIVAMTADIIQGVKEKCTAHGIEHYISKPFDPETFIWKVKDLIKAPTVKTQDCSFAILEKEKGLSLLGGDKELYRQVLLEYTKENTDILETFKEAIELQNYAKGVQIAHKVKSSSFSIGATKVHETTSLLQKAFEAENEEEIKKLYTLFEEQFTVLLANIQQLEE
jgi:signal transduction histidine kinase/DNA-binding response OmpR family regulator